MSRVEIRVNVYGDDTDGVSSSTEICRSYDCNNSVLQSFVDGAIVSLLSGDPQKDIITIIPNEKDLTNEV